MYRELLIRQPKEIPRDSYVLWANELKRKELLQLFLNQLLLSKLIRSLKPLPLNNMLLLRSIQPVKPLARYIGMVMESPVQHVTTNHHKLHFPNLNLLSPQDLIELRQQR